jgi:hypothetical protein
MIVSAGSVSKGKELVRRGLSGVRGLAGLGTTLSFSDGCGNRGTCRNRGPKRGVWPDAKTRRGGSGCGNGGTVPRTGRGRPLCLPSQGDHRVGLPNASSRVWGPGRPYRDASVRLAVGANHDSPVRSHVPGNDHVRATVQKVKRPAREELFIPLGARSCAIFGRCLRTEFRHDSCNTAPR